MKNYILLTLLFAFTASLSAQTLSFDPEEVSKEALANEALVEAKFNVGNETAGDLDFLWRLERADIPDEWSFTICDARLCYGEGTEVCPSNKENTILADGLISDLFKVTLHPNDVPYIGHVFFVLVDNNNSNNEYARMRINYNIGMVSSTSDLDAEDLVVFPNPTADFFQVKNDKNVSSVAIYNIIGKEVNSFKHTADRMYDVSNLETGMYLVRFFDEKLNALRAIRLTKK